LKSYFNFDIIVDNSSQKPVNAVLKIVTRISCWQEGTTCRSLEADVQIQKVQCWTTM